MIQFKTVVGRGAGRLFEAVDENNNTYVCPDCGFTMFWISGRRMRCLDCGKILQPSKLIKKEEHERIKLGDKEQEVGRTEEETGAEAAGVAGRAGADKGKESTEAGPQQAVEDEEVHL